MELTLAALVPKIGSSLIGAVGTWLAKIIIAKFSDKKIVRRALFALKIRAFLRLSVYIALAALTSCLVTIAAFRIGLEIDIVSLFLAITASAFIFEYISFTGSGISASEVSVEKGTRYADALKLCHSELWLLGTGAAKLTAEVEFESAISRCAGNPGTVRFLLTRPNNPVLENAEKQADATKTSYRNAVSESLERLRKLKVGRKFDIEVRFYPSQRASDVQKFRMMFINGSSLLLSYNVYGSGKASEAPQLIISKSEYREHKSGFYFPYRKYFEDLWNESEEWDFEKYVQK